MKLYVQFCLLICTLFTACSADNQSSEEVGPSFSVDHLNAKWEVDRAFRNGKLAASLDGLFFDFSSQDSVATNLIGQGLPEPFQIKGDTIRTNQMYFTVADLDSTRLVLETVLQATPFKFELKRIHITDADNR